ncbi:MAG: hypothetical protein JXB34_10445 [Bacteroidales bacterium]|nr:hypothetical protein [Bacteroidales bacterium]
MADILNSYTVFESNQVLTSAQLNKTVNYLDQQNRLTRAKLIGMGVVCGLEVKYLSVGHTLTISKGAGITSEGFLISLGECKTIKYRQYNLPPGTVYEPFVDPASNEMDIDLWELLTEDTEDGPGIRNLNSPAGFLNDKVVLLFLESYERDLKSCLGKSCDELGKEKELNVRTLLISKEDLATVWSRTNTGKPDALFPEKYGLPEINLPRVLFNPLQNHSRDYAEFSKNYANAILAVFDQVFDALSETYSIYRPLLLESYNEENPFELSQITELKSELINFIENTVYHVKSYLGIQYVYDFFRDLIAGYNEFRQISFDILSECCSDMTRFPKHLMLGEAVPSELSPCQQIEFRHIFIQPPVYNLQKDLIKRTVLLHNRLVLMLESFDLGRVNGVVGEAEGDSQVKITPSFEKSTLMSLRSIPWYYNLSRISHYDKLGKLSDCWNYDVSKKCPNPADGLILSYDGQINDQSTIKSKQETPLYFDIQDLPFLRVEGHTNRNFNEVLARLQTLREQFDLPFETIALQLDTDTSTFSVDYSCGFEDLQEEYMFLRLNFCAYKADLEELFKYIAENQEIIFEDADNPEEIKNYLKKIEVIVQILDSICKSFAECIGGFNFNSFHENYKKFIFETFDFFIIDLKLLEKIKIKEDEQEKLLPVLNGLAQRAFPLICKIVDVFFYNKLLRIYYSFKRREYFAGKNVPVFSEYIKKHPGIEHQAGVPKGGTFIILYNNADENTVIADFALPYIACNKNNCIAMCDSDGFIFDIHPFARPDYAFVTINSSVEIDVMRNDYAVLGGDYIIKADKESEKGGKIKELSNKGPLVYSPPKDFSGYDMFTYRLIETKKKNKAAEDTGKVVILVKAAEVVKTCYSLAILECWGADNVKFALEVRKIKIGPGANIYQLLLDSLKESRGFTLEEIRTNILESEESRRQLLKCAGVEVPKDATYNDLENLILGYQSKNCGSNTLNACFSAEILLCWGRENVLSILNLREIKPTDEPYQQLLEALRGSKGFSDAEISYMVKNKIIRKLLECIGILVNDNTTNQQMADYLKNYQSERCGGNGNDK